MLEMGEPSRRHHQRRAIAAYGIGELHAIRGHAESDALVHDSKRRWDRLNSITSEPAAHVVIGNWTA
jgi:hypothetical protein